MDWPYVISGGALAISTGSLIVAGLSYRHTIRSSQEKRMAALHAEQLIMRPGDHEDEFDFRITNQGPALALQIELLLKTPYASTAGPPIVSPLHVGSSVQPTISVPHARRRPVDPGGFLERRYRPARRGLARDPELNAGGMAGGCTVRASLSSSG